MLPPERVPKSGKFSQSMCVVVATNDALCNSQGHDHSFRGGW